MRKNPFFGRKFKNKMKESEAKTLRIKGDS